MAYDRSIVRIHLYQLALIVRNVAYYRALDAVKKGWDKNYWIFIYNNHLDIAILEWCKIFGSNGEKTHWKNVVPTKDQREFREQMLKYIGVSADEWEAEWKVLTGYRNRHLAHHDFSPKRDVYPNLDPVLKSSTFYYQWLRDHWISEFQPQYPEDFMDYYAKYFAQAKIFAKAAYDATDRLKETLL